MSDHEMSEIYNQNAQLEPVLHNGPTTSESPEPLIAAAVKSGSKSTQTMPKNAPDTVIDFGENLTPVRKATRRPTAVPGENPRPRGEPDRKILGITQFQSSYSGNRTYDYEEKYAPDPIGHQIKPNARVWKVYLDESESYDDDMLRSFRDTIDALLVFAALFSGVVTTLLVQTSQAFQPDYALITTLLLTEQIQLLRAAGNISVINTVPQAPVNQQLGAGTNIDIWINALFIASLSLSLATALLSVLIKQWLQAYSSVTQGSAMQRALIRQFRITGVEKWKVPEIIGVLPLILHASLAAFFFGLALFVRQLNHSFLWIVVSIGTTTFSAYLGSIILPAIWIQCPYRISVLFVPAQYLAWPGKIVAYLFRRVWYHWREWREPYEWHKQPQPPSPSAPAHSLRDAEDKIINATGDIQQWYSTTTVQTIGTAISWLHSLKSNTSIINITTQSLLAIMKNVELYELEYRYDPFETSKSIYSNLALPIPSMFDVAWDNLLDHADIHLSTLTEHQKQNEEIYLDLVGGLLQSKPNLLEEPHSQKLTTGMVQAASHGSLSLLKQLVEWGADLNAPDMTDEDHLTALYMAAEGGHLRVVKFILEHGVDVNAKGGSWDCALGAAARWGKIELVKYLLNHEADPNAHDNILLYAVNGSLEIVKMLIDKGANLQVQGEAALEHAFWNGNLDIVRLLIEHGVSPKKGQILQKACRFGHLEVVKVLLENGADVDALGAEWATALWEAIDGNKKEVVEFLIQRGADVNATGGKPSTPLQLAIQTGHKEIEDILRSHGARE